MSAFRVGLFVLLTTVAAGCTGQAPITQSQACTKLRSKLRTPPVDGWELRDSSVSVRTMSGGCYCEAAARFSTDFVSYEVSAYGTPGEFTVCVAEQQDKAPILLRYRFRFRELVDSQIVDSIKEGGPYQKRDLTDEEVTLLPTIAKTMADAYVHTFND